MACFDNRFGMFVHWGIYALTGLHEQAFARYELDRTEYEALAKKFNPVKFDADALVSLAKEAGMRYICFTAKHHDGFCMWNTRYTDFNIMNTPYGKDILKELSDACARQGMALSIYYSNPDWHEKSAYNPLSSHQWRSDFKETADLEKYREFIKNQITELLTNYGPIYSLFWDIPPCIEDKSINALVRKLIPGILINDRGWDAGDFSTPEREILEGERFTKLTEACQSVGRQSWGYRRDEDYYSASYLMKSIDKTMAMGGSYLLNIGPMADGRVPLRAKQLIKRIGKWYNALGCSLEFADEDENTYSILDNPAFIALKKQGKTYLHFYNGINTSSITFTECPYVPKAAKLMNTGKQLRVRCEKLPMVHFDNERGVIESPAVSLADIPTDKLAGEPIVIEVEW